MDENQTTPTRPVMDIQPQRSMPQPVQRANFSGTQAPAPPAPSTTVEPSIPPEPPLPPTPQPHDDFTPPSHEEMQLPAKHKAPIAAIVIALLIAAVLIGLTVYTYFKTQKEPESNTTTTTQTHDMAMPEDVDVTSEDIDAQLNTADDQKDFNSSELSDEALGL